MPETVQYILIALAAFIALIVVLKLFKVSFRTIVRSPSTRRWASRSSFCSTLSRTSPFP